MKKDWYLTARGQFPEDLPALRLDYYTLPVLCIDYHGEYFVTYRVFKPAHSLWIWQDTRKVKAWQEIDRFD